jgi:hypothetical protein
MTKLFALSLAFLVLFQGLASADVLLEFDFSGATNTAASNTQNSTFNVAELGSSTMTRGAGIGNNNAANSFRGVGFSSNGIDVSNTDFFQFTVSGVSGNLVSIESLVGNFNGTATFSNSPGVTMNWAYSLDGSTFTLSSTNFTRIGSGTSTYVFGGADAAALTNVNSVTFRLLASGQTTTGGWGLQSAATPGTLGLVVNGSISAVPEPTSTALVCLVGISGLAVRRYRNSKRANLL